MNTANTVVPGRSNVGVFGHTALPRLAYVADVPVESSYHGSALVYRLLVNYPPHGLRIIESGLWPSQPERRLPVVPYRSLQFAGAHLLTTRFSSLYNSWLQLTGPSCARKIPEALHEGFDPEAILTVAHGYSWLAAARFAQARALPLHLIVHDDWPRGTNVFPLLQPRLDAAFGRVYRQAVSRLCVSPFMSEDYLQRYGVLGTVLYPSRAAECPGFASPPERLARNDHQLRCAFAGTVNSPGYVRALKLLAAGLAVVGGRLLVFGPLTTEAAVACGLNLPNVEVRGLLKSPDLIRVLREEADVLFVPMSFVAEERPNMELSFPSKLTDYTAVGLPLLIYGPDYCSAVRWARQNRGVAELVCVEDSALLNRALANLNDPVVRMKLAQEAIHCGKKYFAYDSVCRIFHEALLRN